MKNKIIACLDIDGVILGIKKHHSKSWKENINERDLFEERELMDQPGLVEWLHSDEVVGIIFISHNPSEHWQHHMEVKRGHLITWLFDYNLIHKYLDDYFPDFDGPEAMMKTGCPIHNTMDRLITPLDGEPQFTLIDDDVKNLIDWESKYGTRNARHINEFQVGTDFEY